MQAPSLTLQVKRCALLVEEQQDWGCSTGEGEPEAEGNSKADRNSHLTRGAVPLQPQPKGMTTKTGDQVELTHQ